MGSPARDGLGLPHLVVVVAGAEAGDHVTHLDADDVARGNFMFHQDVGSPRNLASLHLSHSFSLWGVSLDLFIIWGILFLW